jgi:hypothetical protein
MGGVMDNEVENLNPYQNMQIIFANGPEDLLTQIKAIKTSIKIHYIGPNGIRWIAFVSDEVKETKESKKSNKFKGE